VRLISTAALGIFTVLKDIRTTNNTHLRIVIHFTPSNWSASSFVPSDWTSVRMMSDSELRQCY